MARFPSLRPASWATAIISPLAIFGTFIPSVRAQDDSGLETIQGTNGAGETSTLLVDRYPALYSGDFGDCMGGQSLINLTSFDGAYYADNMTVLFNLAGTTNLRNETLMCTYADGEDRFDLVFNPCNANFGSLCPLNASVPITGGAVIPVSSSDVSAIPPIALGIPDFEGTLMLRFFSNSSRTEIACFSAIMRNGASFSHPAAVGSTLGVFTFIALIASFFTAIYGVSIPHIRTHYAHSLSVLVIFEVFQSIFFSGALSLNWPSVLPAFWSNFAWSAGMISTPSIVSSINSFTGVVGNASQVGGAGSTVLNNNGGLQQQIYGRSIVQRSLEVAQKSEQLASHLYKRAVNTTQSAKLYEWAGVPIAPGLPTPGDWSGFAGSLSLVGVPAADAFMIGFLWLLILIAILIGVTALFKWILEGFSAVNMMKKDRFVIFREHWIGFIGLIVLRTLFIAFFMMMTLALYQFSYGGKAGPIAIAVIVFLVFFTGGLGVCFYACFYRVRFGKYESSPDRIHFRRKKIMKFIPWYSTVRESSLDEQDKAKTAGSMSFFQIRFVDNDQEEQSIHQNTNFTKRFGWLSARYRRTRWWFFSFWVIYQFVRACFVGGARNNPSAQVIGLFIWEIIAFVAIVCINPFEGRRNTVLAVWMLGLSKVATAGLSIAFLPKLNLARIPTTIVGVIIIVIQGFLVIGVMILIVLGAISSYMSVTRNREVFRPHGMTDIRLKYFTHLEEKEKDIPPPPPPEPEEPKEPYFSVQSVRRAPKIEDEDIDFVPDMNDFNPATSQPSLPGPRGSRANSVAGSMRSHYSSYGNVPYGARVHRASWSSRDFQNWQEDNGRASPLNTPSRHASGHNTVNNSISGMPLRGPLLIMTVLTSRKYGVATIWLVATLGAKSNTKKVTKKAILDVNVKKACETIIEPEAPMALRLQSNLLYGVTKVYNQQWEYLLLDAQIAQNTMRTLFKVTRNNELDSDALKAHPDQLIMMDDPAFAIDMPPPPLDFDLTNMDLNPKGDSQRSSQSMLSIRGRSGSVVSQASSVLGFNIPSSNGGSYQLPVLDPFGDSSAQKPFGAGPGIFNAEEDMILQDDDLFDFDADGQLRDIPASERDARRAASINPQRRIGSDSAASGRVRKEHEDAFVPRIQGVDGNGDFDMPLYGDDDMPVLPDAEPFPLMTGGLKGTDRSLHMSDEDRIMSASQESSVSAEAPQRRKKKVKGPAIDRRLEIGGTILTQWIREYPQNMAAASRVRVKQRANMQAKKNAVYYVYGSGINGVGDAIGSGKFVNPLAMFSGDALMAKITDKAILEPKSKKRTKHFLENAEEEEETPNKRAREDEVGRGNNEDEDLFQQYDDQYQRSHEHSVEVGRDAASALLDHPPSAMPWNVSASLHSHQRGQSSSIQGRIGILGSQKGSVTGRRLTSPLVGRGSALPGDLEQFSQLMDDDMVMYGRDDDGLGSASQASGFHLGGFRSSSRAIGGDEFEMFGVAAGVDTQTAGSSQWMKDVMDRESNNFFEYVKNTIEEMSSDELGEDDDDGTQQKTVTFEELFVPENNSCIVAAQAFYHILSLATKRKVWVEQDVDEDLLIPFGEIRIGVV
ncbi:hypothetical protein BKA65DRAFT_402806 [Rhexocercosporidium sp. MPI-PUGE-AT-0058]|nr:hypothetical protein BKA65DRAFT_402806 [Rhexocercosporidium sp. MPI-PUGE-AT-0058]